MGVETSANAKLWLISAALQKQDGLKTVMSMMQGYRIRDTQDEAVGSFLAAVQKEKPDFSISQHLVMQVPDETIASFFPAEGANK